MAHLSSGEKIKKTFFVDKNDSAAMVKSGGLSVLATPVLVAWTESMAYQMIQNNLEDEGLTSVGSFFEINHRAPTPLYKNVSIEVTLEKINGDTYHFSFHAFDGNIEIADGKHTRVIINTDKFLEKMLNRE